MTCLLPNGKFCGVDEELGLVVVNPLTGETYVASNDPAFKKGKMGCQLLPNGKLLVIPYDCEGREFLAGTKLCGGCLGEYVLRDALSVTVDVAAQLVHLHLIQISDNHKRSGKVAVKGAVAGGELALI